MRSQRLPRVVWIALILAGVVVSGMLLVWVWRTNGPPLNTPVPSTDAPIPTDAPVSPTDAPTPTNTPAPSTDVPIPSPLADRRLKPGHWEGPGETRLWDHRRDGWIEFEVNDRGEITRVSAKLLMSNGNTCEFETNYSDDIEIKPSGLNPEEEFLISFDNFYLDVDTYIAVRPDRAVDATHLDTTGTGGFCQGHQAAPDADYQISWRTNGPPLDIPVPSTDAPIPTSVAAGYLDLIPKVSRLLMIEDMDLVGRYESEEFVSLYDSEDWVSCRSELPDLAPSEDVAIVGAIRDEWRVPECGDAFDTQVREVLWVLPDAQESDQLYRALVSSAQRESWFSTGFELDVKDYGKFWVLRSDYQDGTTATMLADLEGAVIELFVESDAVIDEMNLSALALSAIHRLLNAPLTKGVPILLDKSLFSEETGRSLVAWPAPRTSRVYGLRPTISQITDKYGESDRIVETQLTYGLDELSDPIKVDAIVYYYGNYGFGALVEQTVDEATLEYIKEIYGVDAYQILIDPKNGEVLWVVVE